MKKLFIILVLALQEFSLESQIIDNKIDLCAGFGVGKFRGSSIINDNGFVAPSLYANFKNLYPASLKGILMKKRFFDLGASLNIAAASGWETESYTDYSNSRILIFGLNPLVRIHNPAKDYGLLNRVKFFIETGPEIGFSKLSLANPLFDIHGNDNPVSQPDGSNDLFYGLKSSAGIEVSVNQTLGTYIRYSYGYFSVSSKLYADTSFSDQNIEAGVVFKLRKNKRFFY